MPSTPAKSPAPTFEFVTATTPAQLEAAGAVFREYAQQLGIDLDFQNFDEELATLPGDYAAPQGCLLLAMVDGEVAGCCAMRPLDAVDYPNACEMKRLYVRQAHRRSGLGRQLAEAILDAARVAGYRSILLDTLSDMEAARALYEDLGFKDIPPYYHNPIAGAHYLKADLE
ncbi:MAG: GNAT family N-acetyltransferase [Polaromonas sp.]|nr:GNAT family N-acetyltransferase [Polaromonas sp.]